MKNHKTRIEFMSDKSLPRKAVLIHVRKMTKKDRVVDLHFKLADADNKFANVDDASYRPGTWETSSVYEITLRALMTASEPNAVGITFWREDFNKALDQLKKKWGPKATLEMTEDEDDITLGDLGLTLKDVEGL